MAKVDLASDSRYFFIVLEIRAAGQSTSLSRPSPSGRRMIVEMRDQTREANHTQSWRHAHGIVWRYIWA